MKSEYVDKMLEAMPRAKRRKSLVYGIGINDSNHATNTKIDGKTVDHRAYAAWIAIIRRCCSDSFHKKRPTYETCNMHQDWVFFTNFKSWWVDNYVDGWHLDKDLISPGDNIYGPQNCVYIPCFLNSFTTDSGAARGKYPIGVTFDKRSCTFRSRVNDGRKNLIHLGCFSNCMDAHRAWHGKKIELAHGYKDLCNSIHPELFPGLLRKIESMRVEDL